MSPKELLTEIEKVYDDRDLLFAELAAENIDEALKSIRTLRSNLNHYYNKVGGVAK
jgi:hypothetical protein